MQIIQNIFGINYILFRNIFIAFNHDFKGAYTVSLKLSQYHRLFVANGHSAEVIFLSGALSSVTYGRFVIRMSARLKIG